jgi:hypothetical protein
MYYFGYTALIICLFGCCYLFDCYRRQPEKNLTTLLWSLGFLVSAASIFCSIILAFKETFPFDLREIILQSGQYLFSSLALILFYIGAIKPLTKNIFYKFVFPLLIYLIANSFIIFKVFHISNLTDIAFIDIVFVFSLLLPLSLVLGVIFLLFFQHLYISKQSKMSYFGALLITIGWFLFSLLSLSLSFVEDINAMDIWFGFFGFIELLIIVGIIFLEKGAKESFELHLKIHGLRRKDAKNHQSAPQRRKIGY